MTPMLEGLIQTLREEAEDPEMRRRVGGGGGVPEGWTDKLERVSRGALKKVSWGRWVVGLMCWRKGKLNGWLTFIRSSSWV